MKKKWSSNKVKEAQRWITKRWPEIFTQGPDLPPLSLQIHKELLNYRSENPALSSRIVREVLKRHTNSYGYLYGMLKSNSRYDLGKNRVGEVSAEHRRWARETLRKKQKLAQKVRRDAVKQAREQEKASRIERKRTADARADKSIGSKTNGDKNIPVIRYKQARRKLIKPPTADSIDIAR